MNNSLGGKAEGKSKMLNGVEISELIGLFL